MKILVEAWYRKSFWLQLLRPISWGYCVAVAVKNFSYRLGIQKTTHFPVKVVIVGNLTVGGTGKTPLVIALANYLRAQGFNPGIVSRGYGGIPQKIPMAVSEDSGADQFGDEAVLIARKTQCPVYVSPNRVAAVQKLLGTHNCDVVISDDGLQHLALGRDLEVVVIDGARGFGNGLCLPAGPLRESAHRLRSVNFVVTQGKSQSEFPHPQSYNMFLKPGQIYNLKNPQKTWQSAGQKIHAIAGIGNPERFFASLRAMGLEVVSHAFPDHYQYRPEDIDFGSNAMVLMTEKDAVKCEKFATEQHWCLPVVAECDSMLEAISKSLKSHS